LGVWKTSDALVLQCFTSPNYAIDSLLATQVERLRCFLKSFTSCIISSYVHACEQWCAKMFFLSFRV